MSLARETTHSPTCGETCLPSDQGGFYCVQSTCGDIDYLGKCEGDVAVWCNREGTIQRQNCAASGETCGYIDDEIGYYCR